MSARSIHPLQLISTFAGAVGQIPDSKIDAAFDHLVENMRQWHGEFLLRGGRRQLSEFFTHLARIAENPARRGPVSSTIHRLSAFVADKGDDSAVDEFRAALTPLEFAPVRAVSQAAHHGVEWADEAWRDGRHHRGPVPALQA